MPELPEVAAYKEYFEKYALGRKIASARILDARILRGLSAAALEEELTGSTFLATRQHGKYLFAQTDGGRWLVEHFGMNGRLLYFEDPENPPKYDKFSIMFETGGSLSYINPRMLGWIELTQDPAGYIDRKGLGPSALDLDYNQFTKIFSGRSGEIKLALMNQKLVAGIGNIYADEILFHARLHPKTKIASLGQKQLKSLFQNLRQVLRNAVEPNPGIPSHYILHNRRKGARCPACAAPLHTLKSAARTSYFCPRCQKPPAPDT